MKLSDGEKLILVMLSDIYKHLKIDGEIDPDLVLKSIFQDKAWGLKWEYDGLFNNSEDNPPVVQETCDILDMYRLITSSYDKLSDSDKKRIDKEAKPFEKDIKFQGFDANNDEHYGVGSYLVNDLGRYQELKGAYLNSHSAGSLPCYRRMLKAFRKIADPYGGLTADQIIEILKSRAFSE